MRVFLIIIFVIASQMMTGQSDITTSYIEKYKHIAISEMERTGIPASITLAQGLLESNWGRSELATKSNNHFGIKCIGEWNGGKHFRYDDEYNSFGIKKKSCFREYESAEESFFDHSSFLTDPKKEKRYGFLFNYDRADYESWAKGLSKAGYATDPKYAKKLIQIIEKHELSQYDQLENIIPEEEILVSTVVDKDQQYRISYLNNCRVVKTKGGESMKDLAKEIGVSYRKILKYNYNIRSKNELLPANQIVYLEQKKNYYIGKEGFHKIERGEKISDVSNIYGLHEEYLLAINDIDIDGELEEGSLIKLKSGGKKYRPKKDKYKKTKELFVENSIYLFEKALEPLKQ